MGEIQAVEKVAIWIGVDVAEQLASQNAAELPKSHIAVVANVDSAAVMVAVEAAAKAATDVAANVDAAGSPGNYIVAAAAADREIAAAAAVEVIEKEEVPILAVVPDFATAKVVHIPDHKMAMKLVNNQTSWHSSCIAHCFPHCTAAATVEPLQEIE
jgi:predicted regulator of amino acid metabolism with ACT domain